MPFMFTPTQEASAGPPTMAKSLEEMIELLRNNYNKNHEELSLGFKLTSYTEAEIATLMVAIVKEKPLVKKLLMNHNNIGDPGAIKIAAALPDLLHLERFVLDNNKIGDEGAIKIAEVLPKCQQLMWATLDVDPNKVEWGGMMPAKALACAQKTEHGAWNWAPMGDTLRMMKKQEEKEEKVGEGEKEEEEERPRRRPRTRGQDSSA